MRSYLERMAAVPPQIEPGVGRPPRLLAALGPQDDRAVRRTGRRAPVSRHPNTPAPPARILGPDKWVVSEQAVAIGGDDGTNWPAHSHLDVYSGLPNYRNSWLRQGFDESDLVRGVPTAWPAPWSAWEPSSRRPPWSASGRRRRPRRHPGARGESDGRPAARAAGPGRGAGVERVVGVYSTFSCETSVSAGLDFSARRRLRHSKKIGSAERRSG